MQTTLDRVHTLEHAREFLDSGRPEQALKLFEAPLPPAFSLERDFLRAEALRAQGYFRRCEASYRRILRRGPNEDPALWLDSCLGLAAVKRSRGQGQGARKLIGWGLAVVRRLGWPDTLERLELEAALIDRAEGRYRLSLRRLGKSLSRFRRRRDWAGVGFVLWGMGGARRFFGDLAGSQRDFFASLAASRRAGDRSGMAYALFGLGGVARIRGLLRESQDFYARAGRLLKGTQDLFGLAYAHCGLANALRQRGDWRQARSHYLRSHALYSRLGDELDLAYVDWGLGKVAMHTGDLKGAESLLERARVAFARGRETRGEVLAETALASVLHARGRTARAEALFEKAFRRARAAGLHAHLEIFT